MPESYEDQVQANGKPSTRALSNQLTLDDRPRFEAILKRIGRTSLSLPALPFASDALAPRISSTTVTTHYSKHHRAYLKNVREMAKKGSMSSWCLEEIILSSAVDPLKRKLFNNAAQAWNHGFYWKSLSPRPTRPSGELLFAIQRKYGTMDALKHVLMLTSTTHFGSGWGWLVLERGDLNTVSTANADLPFVHGQLPLLAIDVWEHAYYLDYRNARGDYVKAVVNDLFNWEFASDRYDRARLSHS